MARPKIPTAPLASPEEIEHQFYEALQRGDIEQLMAVWSDDDDISCVHPGGPRMVGPNAIRAAFEGIAEELRRQYNIGYVPTNEGKTGQRKQIKVRVDRANLIIRARDSYIVGSVAPAPTPGKPNK